MKIISHGESRRILENLYRAAAMKKYAGQLAEAGEQDRTRILAQIEREIDEQLRRQKITGH